MVLYYAPDPRGGFRQPILGVGRLKAFAEYELLAFAWPFVQNLPSLHLTESSNVQLDYDTMDAYACLEYINKDGVVEFWVALDRWNKDYMLVNGVTVERDPVVIEIIDGFIPHGEVGLSGHPRVTVPQPFVKTNLEVYYSATEVPLAPERLSVSDRD